MINHLISKLPIRLQNRLINNPPYTCKCKKCLFSKFKKIYQCIHMIQYKLFNKCHYPYINYYE